MIQRVQSIYLLLAVLASAALFFLPFCDGEIAHTILDHLPLSIINGAIVGFSLMTIFLYGNRTLQMNALKLIFILILILVGYSAYQIFVVEKTFPQFGALSPLVTFVFALLAYRGVNSDESLVKSMDRLR